MSDDIEAFLRSGLAERADSAPSYDDPGLADAAIAGAGRIRRRRRVAAAASGAGLLVLGAATFVWQPWIAPDGKGDDTIAADTSTTEAQNELDMEFVVQDDDGYSVLNQDGDSVMLSDSEPDAVYKLADAYLAENASELWTVSFDGESGTAFEKPTADETYTKINSAGEQFAMITPAEDYSTEEVLLSDVTISADPEPLSFTTSYSLTLADWNDVTAVFTADLHSTTGGNAGSYYFNEEFDYGLDSVGAAGFESAVLVDAVDPSNICVADLDPAVGASSPTEQCGPADSPEMAEQLVIASGDDAADPTGFADDAVTTLESGGFIPLDDMNLGEYETRYYENDMFWTDPKGRWELSGTPGETTWLLINATGDEPTLSELAPPSGAIMPVLSYS
jgi:hypothetical protein